MRRDCPKLKQGNMSAAIVTTASDVTSPAEEPEFEPVHSVLIESVPALALRDTGADTVTVGKDWVPSDAPRVGEEKLLFIQK